MVAVPGNPAGVRALSGKRRDRRRHDGSKRCRAASAAGLLLALVGLAPVPAPAQNQNTVPNTPCLSPDENVLVEWYEPSDNDNKDSVIEGKSRYISVHLRLNVLLVDWGCEANVPETITLDWATADGTATAGTDYTAGSGTMTFDYGNFGPESDNNRDFHLRVEVLDDNVDEPDEEFSLELSNITTRPGEVHKGWNWRIEDDDDPPTVTLHLSPDSIDENGGTSTVTATLNHPSSKETRVVVSVAPVSPAVAGDYAMSFNRGLTIPAGETDSTGVVTITAVDNSVYEGDKTVTVSGTPRNTLGVTAPQNVTLTITDDERPRMSVAPVSSPVAEGENAQFTVTRTVVTTGALTVNYDVSETGDMVASGEEGAKTVAFADGESEKTVTVPTEEDLDHEADSTVTLTLTADAAYDLGTATAEVTVEDDDNAAPMGKPTIDDTTPVVGETLTADPSGIADPDGLTGATFTWQWTRVASGGTETRISGATTASYTVAAGDVGATLKVEASFTDDDGTDETVESAETATVALPMLSIGDASVDEGNSGSVTLNFTVDLSQAATETVTVDWTTADGTATAGADYTAGNGRLTFNTGDSSKTVSVTVAGDNVDEPDETLTVRLSSPSGATIGDGTATGTIRDDDDPPTVTLVLSPDSIDENGGTSTVTATLNHPSSEATTVTVSVAPVSPAVAGDYTLSTNRGLTIAAGATTSTGTVTITAVINTVDAPHKAVTVSGTATNSQGVTNPAPVTLTIVDDDDTPKVTLVLTPASITEAGGTSTVTARLNHSSTDATTVTVSASPVSPAVAGDYTLSANRELTIAAGATTSTGTVTITAVINTVDAPHKAVTVSGTATNSQGVTNPAPVTLTIVDDDDTPKVTLVLTPASITEAGGTSTVTARLNHPSSEATTVTVSASPESPAVAGDYTLSGNLDLTIMVGATTSTGTVTITAVDNDVVVAAKEVTVSATATNSQGVTAPDSVTLAITEDDELGLSVADASVAEGDSGGTTMTFTVMLNPAAVAPVTVDWATADGTATAGTDYTAGNGSLTFNAGDSTKTVSVTVTGDNVDEPDETFTVTLSSASGATIGDGEATGTIRDDDDPPTVTLVLSSNSITEVGQQSTVTATLDHASSEETTVTVSVAPVAPAVAGDYRLSTNRVLTIAAGATTSTGTVTVTSVNNVVDAPDKTVTVSGTATNSQGVTAPAPVTLTIRDNDTTPTVTLVLTPDSITEVNEQSAVTATLDHPSSKATTVTVSVAPVSPAVAGDYTLSTNRVLTIPARSTTSTGTVTVTSVNNTVDAPHKTVTVSGTATNSRGVTDPDDVTLTIRDNDATPTVTLVLTPASITEAGGTSTVTARLNHPSSEATTVTVSVAPVSPAVAGDYTLSGNTKLTIPAGETDSTGVVTMTAVNNNVYEGAKTVTVSGTATNSQGITAPQNVTLTITDDEAAPLPRMSVAQVASSVAEGADAQFTVTRTVVTTGALTVNYRVSESGAMVASGEEGAKTVDFADGDTEKTVTVPTVEDSVHEADSTVTLTLTADAAYDLGTATADVTVEDDDNAAPTGAPTIDDTTPVVGQTLTANPSGIDDPDGLTNRSFTWQWARVSGGTDTRISGATAATYTVVAADEGATLKVEASFTDDDGTTETVVSAVTSVVEAAPRPRVSVARVASSVAEGADAQFTVTRTVVTTGALTVSYSVSESGAVVASGEEDAKTVDFADGDTEKTVTVPTVEDSVHEADSVVTLTLTADAAWDLGTATADVTVEDDDNAAPTGAPTIDDTTPVVGETLTARAAGIVDDPDGLTGATFTWQWFRKPSGGTATPIAGATSATYTVVAADVGATLRAQVSFTDDDGTDETVESAETATVALPMLSIGDASVDEGDSGSTTMTFTVRLSSTTSGQVTVDWATSDGTATAGTDYTAGNGSLTFSAGDSSKTVSVTVAGDDVDEPNETFTVTLSSASGADISDGTATGTITDDDDTPTVTLVLTPDSITEVNQQSTVTATLDHASSEETTVTVSVAPVAPAVAGDYTLSTNRELTIPAGATRSQGTVTVTSVDNAVDAPHKTVTVSGTATNSRGVTAPTPVTLTITDDEAAVVTVAAETETVPEGEDAVFILTRTGVQSDELAVTFTVTGGDTVLTNKPPPTGVTFQANENTARVTLATGDDDADEPDAMLTLTLDDGGAYDLGTPSRAVVTVQDDEDPPTVSISRAGEGPITERTPFLLSFEVKLSRPSDVPVVVKYTLTRTAVAVDGDDAEGSATDMTTSFALGAVEGDVTFEPGETRKEVSLETDDDRYSPNGDTIEITLQAGAGYELDTSSPRTVMVTVDEAPMASIDDAESVTEGAPLVFAVKLNRPSAVEITVAYTLLDNSSATENDDYMDIGTGIVTFAPDDTKQEISLETMNDGTVERDETVMVELSVPDGSPATLDMSSRVATGTIEDDASLPVVTVAAVSGQIREGEEAKFELTRTGGVSEALTVMLEVSERGGDMVPAALEREQDVTFEAGASKLRFGVKTANDGSTEPNSEVTVAVLPGGDSYHVHPVDNPLSSATVEVVDAGEVSVLAQGRRVGAASLLRRHVQRFSQLTSDVALGRLDGGHRTSTVDVDVGDGGVTANGDVTVALLSGWDGWASVRYSKLDGSADGSVWDVYAGADRLGADGRTAYGVLLGYEPGRVTAEGVRLEAEHVQLGLYGAHRLNETLTVDGAVGWGRGKGDLSLVEGAPVTASYRSERIAVRGDLTGDFGWGGEGLRVEPQIGLLYAEEGLDAFTDSVGSEAPEERLWLGRLGLGPKVTWSLGNGTMHGKLRVNLDAHNLESDGGRTEDVSASLELGHRWRIDKGSSLDLSAGFDGLGSDWFSSGTVGLRYEARF